MYVCIYKTVFNPVNSELGTIPSRTNEIFKNRILNLSNPGQELNLNEIHRENDLTLLNLKYNEIRCSFTCQNNLILIVTWIGRVTFI